MKYKQLRSFGSLFLPVLLCFLCQVRGNAQEITGRVFESGTGKPLKNAAVTILSTGEFTETSDSGYFSIAVPEDNVRISVTMPGYDQRVIYQLGRKNLTISMVPSYFSSFDDAVFTPISTQPARDIASAFGTLSPGLESAWVTSANQLLQGKMAGVSIVDQSGMAGQKTWASIGGISSMSAHNDPLVIIDGMIHLINYSNNTVIQGYTPDPMDIVDVDDISSVTVIRNGLSYLGSTGSTGVININTEQEGETSTSIKVHAYEGVAFTPKVLPVLDDGEFRQYFTGQLQYQGYTPDEINTMYPWLNGEPGSPEYYRYNNNTQWQELINQASLLQKYYIFLKGGDDIATYNISTGFLRHNGPYDGTYYSRYNLRINGRINITDKFSVTPNAKLSLSSTSVPELGDNLATNPALAGLRKSPLMAPYAKDEATGQDLEYIDDVGAFNVSNPVALITNGLGRGSSAFFVTSAKLQYRFNRHFTLQNLTGLDYSNSRQDIFIPDVGVIQMDSVYNSPRSLAESYQSTQNHTTFIYSTDVNRPHQLNLKLGAWFMMNKYAFDKGIDLNTATDEFTQIGQGNARLNYLREIDAENRGLNWASFYGSMNYNYLGKYFLNAVLAVDGNSATNLESRYNLYPSVAGAWLISAEKFMHPLSWLDELKVRAGWDKTGNMFTSIYDLSKLYYTQRKFDNFGVLVRDYIPNEDMELETKTSVNAGIDISLFDQRFNIHADVFQSNVNNLIIPQQLPTYLQGMIYFDNGAALKNSGLEVSADFRFVFSRLTWQIGGNVSFWKQEVTRLDLFNKDPQLITTVGTAQYVTRPGSPINAFYGYETNGIYQSEEEAMQVTGPKGNTMHAGDIKYTDKDNNLIIDENDKTIIGDPNPDLFGGFFTTLTYRGFDLNLYFNYSIGNDIYNFTRQVTLSMDSYANQQRDILEQWSSSNSGSGIPAAAYGDPSGNAVFSDRWIDKGSYLRLKQVALNYHLSQKGKYFKGMILYVTAQNLLTITNYSGYDPEFMYHNNPFYMGIDYSKIPHRPSVMVGVKVDL